MKNYVRLLTRITNTPLFISESKLELITENVLVKLALGQEPSTTFIREPAAVQARTATKEAAKKSANDIAMIDIFDSLQAKGVMGGLSGFTTYESIRSSMQSAVDSGYSNIMLNIDSPGGEVTGLFALTSYIRALTAQGVNVISYIDGMATSAAYAIAAASSKRYATNTSLLGSIAAIMVHLEVSKADATAGKTYTIFRSKSEKALGDAHTELSDKAKAKFTMLLDNMDTLFNNDIVESMPQLSLQSIIDMKGSEFIASEALQLGLIDAIVPEVDSAIKLALQDKISKPLTKLQTTHKGVKMDTEELQKALLQAQAEVAQLKAEAVVAGKSATEAERARTLAILSTTTTLKLDMATAIKHITKGYDAEASLDMQTEIAEALGRATSLEGAPTQAALDPDINAKLSANGKVVPENKMEELRAAAKAAGMPLKTSMGAK